MAKPTQEVVRRRRCFGEGGVVRSRACARAHVASLSPVHARRSCPQKSSSRCAPLACCRCGRADAPACARGCVVSPVLKRGAGPLPPCVLCPRSLPQMLDDNQSLIMAILENQNLGKLDQCAQCVPPRAVLHASPAASS